MLDVCEILNRRNCVLSIVGPHAGESVEEIYGRKSQDILNVGKTFWVVRCGATMLDKINELCLLDKLYVMFLLPSSPCGSRPTQGKILASGYLDGEDCFRFPSGLSPVTGSISGNSAAFALDELKFFNHSEMPLIDLWHYRNMLDNRPIRFSLGKSTALCSYENSLAKGMSGRFRAISAIGRFCPPFCVRLTAMDADNLPNVTGAEESVSISDNGTVVSNCGLCGREVAELRNHVVRVHRISFRKYLELFPNQENNSSLSNDGESKRTTGGCHYHKRFVYLLPDGTYASKSDKYKRAWNREDVLPEHVIDATTIDYVPDYAKRTELGVEGEDYVVCAICGAKKGSLTQHLRKAHEMSSAEYENLFHLPVHCRKNADAFHSCSMNRWKTLFESGVKSRAVPKVLKGEASKTRRRDDISSEGIEAEFLKGSEMADVCTHFHCSDTTLRNVMRRLGLKKPSRTVLAIRRAVVAGAERNLEDASIEEIDSCLKEFGKEETLRMYGVKRTVFDTWTRQLRGSE